MIHPLPLFPPVFPTGKWWTYRLQGLVDGLGTEESCMEANKKSGLKSREWMRGEVEDRSGGAVMLSVPVVHGASALKNQAPATWRIADDKVNLRKLADTLRTLYGHTPYFNHLFPELRMVDMAGLEASEACRRVDDAILRFLGFSNVSLLNSARRADLSDSRYSSAIARMKDYNPSLCVLDLLFRHGPQAIIKLLSTLEE